MKVRSILKIILVASFLISVDPLKGLADEGLLREEVILKGFVTSKQISETKFSSPTSDELPSINLSISEKNGKYFWTSNGSKPLVRIQKKGEKEKYTIFLNTQGEGQIIIRNATSQGCTDIKPLNYVEYRLTPHGGLQAFKGYTDPYPYPDGGWCSEW